MYVMHYIMSSSAGVYIRRVFTIMFSFLRYITLQFVCNLYCLIYVRIIPHMPHTICDDIAYIAWLKGSLGMLSILCYCVRAYDASHYI